MTCGKWHAEAYPTNAGGVLAVWRVIKSSRIGLDRTSEEPSDVPEKRPSPPDPRPDDEYQSRRAVRQVIHDPRAGAARRVARSLPQGVRRPGGVHGHRILLRPDL